MERKREMQQWSLETLKSGTLQFVVGIVTPKPQGATFNYLFPFRFYSHQEQCTG